MKAYSKDLRKRVIETKIETNESDEKIAERFKVSRSWVNKLVRQYKQTGNARNSTSWWRDSTIVNSRTDKNLCSTGRRK